MAIRGHKNWQLLLNRSSVPKTKRGRTPPAHLRTEIGSSLQLKSSISYKKMCLDNILLLWGAPECCHERILTIHIQHIYKLQTYHFQWPVRLCTRSTALCRLQWNVRGRGCGASWNQRQLLALGQPNPSSDPVLVEKSFVHQDELRHEPEEPLSSRQKGRKWTNSFSQIAKSHWRTMSMYWLASSPLI